MDAQDDGNPHDALRALRERLQTGYRIPGEEAQLRDDVTELLEYARAAADLLFQVRGWVCEWYEDGCDGTTALGEIGSLVEHWE